MANLASSTRKKLSTPCTDPTPFYSSGDTVTLPDEAPADVDASPAVDDAADATVTLPKLRRRGLVAALGWGAEAVWVGTRFVAAKESACPPRHQTPLRMAQSRRCAATQRPQRSYTQAAA